MNSFSDPQALAVEPQLISLSDNTMCLQHDIDGIAWRFHYQRVEQQWVRYCRVNVSNLH